MFLPSLLLLTFYLFCTWALGKVKTLCGNIKRTCQISEGVHIVSLCFNVYSGDSGFSHRHTKRDDGRVFVVLCPRGTHIIEGYRTASYFIGEYHVKTRHIWSHTYCTHADSYSSMSQTTHSDPLAGRWKNWYKIYLPVLKFRPTVYKNAIWIYSNLIITN